MDSDGLLADAANRAEEIEKCIGNFKKEGQKRTKDSVEKRLDKLHSYWVDYELIHAQLEEKLDENHEYFTKGLYHETNKLYTEGAAAMYAKIRELSNLEQNTVTHPKSVEPPQEIMNPFPSSQATSQGGTIPKQKPSSINDDVTSRAQHTRSLLDILYPKQNSTMQNHSNKNESSNSRSFTQSPDHSNANNIPQGTFPWNFNHPAQANMPPTFPPSAFGYQGGIPYGGGYYYMPFPPQGQVPINFPGNQTANDQYTWSHAAQRPKLPPIKIGKFSGQLTEWKSFYEMFVHIIHKDPRLHDTEKFSYLLSYLEGEAKGVVAHLSPTGDHYQAALELLKKRYDNKRGVTFQYVNILLDSKKVEFRNAKDIIALHDKINEFSAGMKSLGYSVEDWDPVIVGIIIRKLDGESLRLFEESILDPTAVPTTQQLQTFLLKRHHVLNTLKAGDSNIKAKKTNKDNKDNKETSKKAFHATNSKVSCPLCKEAHILTKCPKFLELNTFKRRKTALKLEFCLKCLSHKKSAQCVSKGTCQQCGKDHHTLLHFEKKNEDKSASDDSNKSTNALTLSIEDAEEEEEEEQHVVLHSSSGSPLFPTALVKVKAIGGNWTLFRALIDTGSGDTFISERAAQELSLPRKKINAPVRGIGGATAGVSKHQICIQVAPRFPSTYQLDAQALVLSSLTGLLPQRNIESSSYKGLKIGNVMMADPTFMTSGPIDLILGSQIYATILKEGVKKNKLLCAQNTELGWILTGTTPTNRNSSERKAISMITMADIDEQLRAFWEMDQTQKPDKKIIHHCEKHFAETHTRTQDGRYEVKLPFKDDTSKLGDSRKQAMARLVHLEKKFATNEELRKEYSSFMEEYIALGHMTIAPRDGGKYYLPHHAVFKQDSSTTKTRVVFDASCKTNTGVSLNCILYAGPKLQDDLSHIIIRWRKHRFVYTADIEKMFRQIQIAQEDRDFQRILWRPTSNDPVKEYRLNTVTYGTAPATFLSVKVLFQLAKDEGEAFPQAVTAFNDFYVDDLMTGADTVEQAQELQNQLIGLLQKGGMNLRKWTSNSPDLLTNLSDTQIEAKYLHLNDTDTLKTLGIGWHPHTDHFQYKVKTPSPGKLTKRKLLSDLASIFDPVGWIGPVVLRAKLIMQRAWKCQDNDKEKQKTERKLHWDTVLPMDIQKDWTDFIKMLPEIEKIKIPRYSMYSPGAEVQLHGFSDASEKAYGAVVYTKIIHNGKYKITLLAAKSRVAPTKAKVTLPKLELCAAVLLAELLDSTARALQIPEASIHAWSDSQITLAWIAKDPGEWETYVAHRVSKIHELTDRNVWKYVETAENPADLVSRGICPSKLRHSELWWAGPSWLRRPDESWPDKEYEFLQEMDAIIAKAQGATHSLSLWAAGPSIPYAYFSEEKIPEVHVPQPELLNKYDSLTKTVRITAYCLRFIKNCQPAKRVQGELSVLELAEAENKLVKILQAGHYNRELHRLRQNLSLPSTSKILSLNPFLDNDEIMRVGGRLEKSELSFNQKHPILIPHKTHFATLIIRDAHESTIHGGISLTLNYSRNKYWIPNSRKTVKTILDRCVYCFRQKRHTPNQLMGDLPQNRVTPSSPFASCGIDFAGPFYTKASKGRGITKNKGYIAVFVCFSTKAVHLELVSDLSTETFIAALKRFIGRRGKPANIYSDNGTNLVGAKNALDRELRNATESASKSAAKYATDEGIQWHMIPPAAPHFGGLWEAAVKSTKKHLKALMSDISLTFEEFTTVLTRVEAVLNSRPIAPLSNDPNDLAALSPGHFLIGRQMLAPPEELVQEENPLKKWRTVTRLQQELWKRWSRDYLQQLQQRHKWKQQKEPIKVGELVVMIDENSPPQQWPLARVTEIHPGEDGLPRVADIKTKNGIKRRPITKLARLPIQQELEEEPAQHPTTISNFCHTTHIRARPSRHSWKSILLFMLLALLTLGAAETHNYSIVQPESGLYVERLGTARLKRGVLRVQIDYPYDQLFKDKRLVEETFQNTSRACEIAETLTHDVHCKYYVEHLRHKADSISQQIDNVASSSNRKKRGLLGKALTYVFGVNDEIYKEIDELKHNENENLALVKQHNMLLNAKIDQTVDQVNAKMSQFTQKMNQVLKLTEELQAWHAVTDHNRVRLEVLSMYTSASDYLDELNDLYRKLIRAKTGSGNILEFASRRTIRDAIKITLEKIGSNYQVVENLQSRVDFAIEKGKFHVYGRLHIMDKNLFQVMHVTPIPLQLTNGSFLMPDTVINTIAVDFNGQGYFEFHRDICAQDLQLEYICAPHAIHNIKEQPACLIDEIYNRHPKKACNSRILEIEGILWKKLMMSNVWLYMTKNPETIAIICHGEREEHLITAVGIIKITGGCVIESGTMSLRSTMEPMVKASSSFIKPLDFTQLAMNINATRLKVQHPQPLKPFQPIENVHVPSMDLRTHEDSTIIRHPGFTIPITILIGVFMFAVWKSRNVWWPCCIRRSNSSTRPQDEALTLSEKFNRLLRRIRRSSLPVPSPAQDVHA